MTEKESKALEVQSKKELETTEEKTAPARYYVPYTDILETDDALTVTMEMPGVEKDNVNITVEQDVLQVEGRLDFSSYKDLEPLYSEYNVGHYSRKFSLSSKIDQDKISADMNDGVLCIHLAKAEETKPQKIKIN